jgi:PAS domain S-box-containing protein
MFPLVTLVSVLGGGDPETTFSSLIIGIILSSILLNREGAMAFSAFCFLFLLATPFFIPQQVPNLRSILTPLVLVAISSGLSTILMAHRDELEHIRQEALRTSEERLRLALDAARMGTWEWDPASGEVSTSENGEAMFGLPPHTFDGTPAGYLRSVHREDRAAVEKELTDVFSGQKRGFEILHRVIWPDGSIHWIEIEGRSTSHDGHARVNGTVKDVTDRKLAEAERDRLIQELESKNAELERFTYTVSHDLKSPLITVRGFLGSIEQDIKDGRHDRLGVDIERVFSATSRMHKLLDELLSLSRIGRIVNPPERVAMADLVREASAMVRGRLDEAHARVEIQEDIPDAFGDRSRLVQVFQNLLDNAAKFLGDQKAPRILVGSRKSASDGRPVFFVQDNGAGVDPKDLERMLGLFQKLDARSGGTGVGLAIVKRIVEVHGGRLWVESEGRGLGTTVCFTLPTRAAV